MFPGLGSPTVVPAELGTTGDPRALIPGNPDAILAKLATLTKLSAGIDEASSAFNKIDTDHWQGPAGDGFRKAFSQEVPHWHNSATAFDAARTALQDYGHALRAAQNQAADAIEMFNRAMQATKTAQAQYDAASQQHNAQGAAMPPMAPFADPGAADRHEAQAKLDDARKAVKDAGDAAAQAIGTQRDSAPQGPGPLESAWAAVTDTGASLLNADWHVATGALGAVADMAKPLIALNPLATFTHPMSAVSNVANMGTGLLHAANHPVQLAKSMVDVDDWGKDPAAAVGKTAVNIGSLFAGGEGAAAKGVEVGAEGANLARAAGTAEKATTKAADAGETVEQADHTPLKPADWAPQLPPSDTPFGPQGSQSLDHGSPAAGGASDTSSVDRQVAQHQLPPQAAHNVSAAAHAGPDLGSADTQAAKGLQNVDGQAAGLQQSLHGRLDHLGDPSGVQGSERLPEQPTPTARAAHAGPDLAPADAQAAKGLQNVDGQAAELKQTLHGRLDHLDPHPDVPGGEHPDPDLSASRADHEAYRQRLDQRLQAQGRGSFEDNVRQLRAEHPGLDHLPDEEAMAIRRYVGEDANMINRALRTGDPEDLSHLQPDVNTLRSGLGRLPDFAPTPDCPVVYRNIHVADEDIPQMLERYEQGAIVQEKAFISASKDTPPAWFGDNVQFVIENLRNAKDLEFLNPKEREVLWPDGNRFEVLHREHYEVAGRREWKIHLRDRGR